MNASARIARTTLGGLHVVARIVATGLVAIGSCFFGGASMYVSWRKEVELTPQRPYTAATIRHEASTGIAQIEAFLTAQATPSGTHDDPT